MKANAIAYEVSVSAGTWLRLHAARLIANVTLHHAGGSGRVIYISTAANGSTGQATLHQNVPIRLEGVDLSELYVNSNFTPITLSVIGNSRR